ncbi:DUF4954 family protein [Weeksellaceae bacterium TAE3-ERU29]|nr:DUF4954 family protein [Weeksellaceae bacterium TAE3-ERU29]
MIFINLSETQITQLESQCCKAENWNNVFITNNTDLNLIHSVQFSGKVEISEISGSFTSPGGVTRNNGIYNTHLHNCRIGKNPFIKNIKNYIANYIIGDNVKIEGINLLAVEGESTFGNGVIVEPINEGGGRSFPIFDDLTAQSAYILCMYRHREKAIAHLKNMINKHTEKVKSDRGFIGNNVSIRNTRKIINVNINDFAELDGVAKLKNGTLNSSKDSPIYIGAEVMAENFIICGDSIIDNATLINNCFVGQGCVLDKHYSAEHSVFFANCQGFNGEACSIFAGPFTVTHHKSTLLIAGIFSFMNAGSGSNQSNHMYKLGPIHQGILERGAKTTSDSYLLWPSKVGPFTLVMGRHYNNTDSSDLPFSYLIENNNESILVPGVNLRSVGTVRDAQKWPKRDRRNQNSKKDCVNFNLLSPFTIHKMYNGKHILEQLEKVSGENVLEYTYKGLKIKRSSLLKGKELYEIGIHKFLGNSLINRIYKKNIKTTKDLQQALKPTHHLGKGKWIDVAGMICPLEALEDVLEKIELNKINNIDELNNAFHKIHTDYYEMEWTWAAELYNKIENSSVTKITPEYFISFVKKWKDAVVCLDKMVYNDAKKEFSLSTQVGFGTDGEEKEKQQDFMNVRGNFNTNSTVQEILAHIERKSDLANRVIKEMELIIKTENKK